MYYRQHDISPPADDTCEWIWDHPIYLEWSHQRRGLLWIKGKPGAGKSKLVRHISKKMEEHKERNVILASHFFHGRGDVIQRNHLGLFRSLLHQLLQKDPELLQAFSSTYKMKSESCGEYGKKWTWETGELRHIFTHYLSKIAQRRPVCIFIDALDECGEDAAIELVELFYELMTKSNSAQSRPSICFSCRHFPVLAVEGGLEICVEAENHVDLSAYIQTQLQNMVPNPDTASHLSSEILDRSQGNFQWTCLCIRQVVLLYKRGKSRRALEKSIRDMPSQLDDLYTGLLRYDNNADRNQALRLMRWIHFALRPLTVDELRWALLVSGDHTCESLKRYQEVEDFAETEDQMERRMVDLSRGLAEVTIHNGEHKAQFIHQSVDDFFVEKGFQLLSDTGCDNVAGVAHVQLSLSCLRYMAVEEITSHLATIDSGLREEFPLLRYASQCWHLHAQRAEEIECSLTELSSFLREPSLDALQTWYELRAYFEFRIRTPYRGKMNTLLHAVANYNLRSILPFILGSNDVDINARDLMDETPLIVAAGKGHDSIVRLLLDRDDVRVDHINSNFETALLKAARKGHRAVVRLLLKRIDLDVNLSDVDKLTDRPESSPLLSAISNQRMAIVSQLLARKEVDVNCVNRLGETPLTLALRRVDEDLMRLLLSHPKIDVNARDGYRDTPLTLATTLARTEVVQLLLSHPNIDVNARAGYRDTPLTLATTLARTEVVPLLLSHLKIDVNARDWYDATPLTSATYFGRTEIVRLLLSHPKIDVNARTTHDATPLILATRYDETEVVQLLLSHPKIDVNARDRYGDTPLTLATADRWNEAVRLLLSHPKIDVNARDMNGDTPLSLARKGGREAILELLLRRNDIVVDD
ncbi:MAG: hypothetical protein M1833_004245 [Piccolia ochrophora]|nr:MAG: hypothetical protein M1833_004245 [Piccolia ochrophora]